MTAAEFEQRYAQSVGGVERLRGMGRVVVACDCGDESCSGFASMNREFAVDEGMKILLPEIPASNGRGRP